MCPSQEEAVMTVSTSSSRGLVEEDEEDDWALEKREREILGFGVESMKVWESGSGLNLAGLEVQN